MGRAKVKKGYKSPALYLNVPVDLFDDERISYFVTKFGCCGHVFLFRLWLQLASSPGWRIKFEEELFEKIEKEMGIKVDDIKEMVKYCSKRKNGLIVMTKSGEEDWFLSSPFMENRILGQLIGKRMRDNSRKRQKPTTKKLQNNNKKNEDNWQGRPVLVD
jgi:hypothetical protein